MRMSICLASVLFAMTVVVAGSSQSAEPDGFVGSVQLDARCVLRHANGIRYELVIAPDADGSFRLRLDVPDDKAVIDRLAKLAGSPVRVRGTLVQRYDRAGAYLSVTDFAISSIAPTKADGRVRNVALAKKVTGAVHESPQYARAAWRLTDGNIKTDAYPGALSLDYTIDLTTYHEGDGRTEARGYDIDSLVIHWGHYGRHFPGAKRPDGSWVPAAYKADYVNNYRIHYQVRGSDKWHLVHEAACMPTVEQATNVTVQRIPAEASESEGEVTTTIALPTLRNVTAVRIRASGGHWVGVFEVCALGRPAAAPASSTPPPVPSAPLEPGPSMEPAPTTAPVKE